MNKYLSGFVNIVTKPSIVNQTPLHIQLGPTTYCNLDCTTCNRKISVKNPQNMSFQKYKVIIDALNPQKLSISGLGETLLNPDLTAMISYAKSKKIAVNTATNGTLLKKVAEDIVKSGLNLLKISIDSATAETYKKIRKKDYFDQIVCGIRAVQEAKQKFNSSSPFLRFQCVIQKDNLNEMAQMIELAHQLNVDVVRFQILSLIYKKDCKEMLVGDMTIDMVEERLRSAHLAAKKYNVATNADEIINNLPQFWHNYDLTEPQNTSRCILPWFSSYVGVDGSLFPCCWFGEAIGEAIMGNILEDGFEKTWNSPKYQKFRKAIKENKRPFPLCKICNPQNLTDMLKFSKMLPNFLKI